MINVSNQFKEKLNNGHKNYLCYANITLLDGTILNIESDKIWNNGLSIEEAVSSDNSFDIGSAIVNQATLVLNNIYDEFSKYDFGGAKVILYVGLNLPNKTIEKVRLGTFFVDEPKYNGAIITLNCLDEMSKFDKDYSYSKLTYPATLLQIVQDACSVCNVISGISSLPNGNKVIKNRPNDESLTFRQILQWVGQLTCQWFRIDRNGKLISNWYDIEAYESIGMIFAGTIGDDLQEKITGGTFGDNIQNKITGGTFGDRENYHNIYSLNSMQVDTDDVVITGIKVIEFTEDTQEEPVIYQVGKDGYVLEISNNKLITKGTGEEVASFLGKKLIGLRFRPLNVSFQSNPTIEAGDIALISDYKGNTYKTLVTRTKFQIGTVQTIACGAKSAARNSASRYSQSTQAYSDTRKQFQKNRTEWEKAMEELSDRISNSSGLYMTEEKQSDGSKIYYMHDKPTIEESMIVWKMTAEAVAVSTDGGKTWNAGLTVDGSLITKIMNTIGINFDWGVGGTLIIQTPSGQQTMYVNADTGEVRMKVSSLEISGKTIEEIANEKVNNFVSAIYDPKIAELQKQIDGQIESYYYDYQPTLYNVPASSWKTEEDKAKHEGDLFYWKSKGFAYRFFKNGSIWTWQLVQDTDVTKALQAAANAQDTADQKRRTFVSTPAPPYDVGDLWVQGSSGDIMRCKIARQSGAYASTDWEKASKYTDDTTVKNLDSSLNQVGVFNRLTNNGQTQGIYIENGKIYINATYIKSGTLVLGGSLNSKGRLSIRNSSGTEIGRWDNNGIYVNGGSIYNKTSTTGSSIYGGRIHMTYGSTNVGYVGTNQWVQNNAHKGLVFDLEYEGKYMTWAYKKYSTDSVYTMVWSMSRAGSVYDYLGLWAGLDIYLAGNNIYLGSDKYHKIHNYSNGLAFSDNQNIFFEMGSTTKAFISSSGIGISGGSGLTAYNNTALNFYSDLNMHYYSILNSSDERLKKNILKTDKDALDILRNIEIVSYDWIETGKHVNVGVIAQQVEKFIPEAVDVSDKGLYSVKNDVFIPYLIRAMQQLCNLVLGESKYLETGYLPGVYTEDDIKEALKLAKAPEEIEKIQDIKTERTYEDKKNE